MVRTLTENLNILALFGCKKKLKKLLMYARSDTSSIDRWNQCGVHLYRCSPWLRSVYELIHPMPIFYVTSQPIFFQRYILFARLVLDPLTTRSAVRYLERSDTQCTCCHRTTTTIMQIIPCIYFATSICNALHHNVFIIINYIISII